MADLTKEQIIALKSVRHAAVSDLEAIYKNCQPGSFAVVAPCVVALRGIISHCEVALGRYQGVHLTVDGGWSPSWDGLMHPRLVEIEAALGA